MPSKQQSNFANDSDEEEPALEEHEYVLLREYEEDSEPLTMDSQWTFSEWKKEVGISSDAWYAHGKATNIISDDDNYQRMVRYAMNRKEVSLTSLAGPNDWVSS